MGEYQTHLYRNVYTERLEAELHHSMVTGERKLSFNVSGAATSVRLILTLSTGQRSGKSE